MQRARRRYEYLLLALFLVESAAADPFTGEFRAVLGGEVYQLSITGFARGQYDGEYRGGGERLPLDARRFGDRIVGQIGSGATRFGFLAQIQTGNLLLRFEDGSVVLFKRGPAISQDQAE